MSSSSSESIDYAYTNATTSATEGTITYNVGGDMTGVGYNANGKHIKGDIKGDLTLNSLQNTGTSSNSSQSMGVNGGNTHNNENDTDKQNMGANFSTSNGSGNYAQTQVSSIIGSESVDITVGGTLSMAGSTISNATVDNETGKILEDRGNLQISAQSFEFTDLKDSSENSQTGFNIGTSTGNPMNENNTPSGSTTIGFTNTGSMSEGYAYATIGQGNISIADGTDISNLNRDVANNQVTTKELTTGALNSGVTVDHRWLTDEGRASILEDYKNFGEGMKQLGNGLKGNIVVKSIENALTDSETNIIEAVQDYIDTDGKVVEIQEDKGLTAVTNGLTTKDAATVDSAVDALTQIANENDTPISGGIYGADDGTKGYSYDDGNSMQVGLNTNNVISRMMTH